MTKQDRQNFEGLSAERIACIFSDSLWDDASWLNSESKSQLTEQCNEHRMYVYQFQTLPKAKHDGIHRKCNELKDEVRYGLDAL